MKCINILYPTKDNDAFDFKFYLDLSGSKSRRRHRRCCDRWALPLSRQE